MNLLQTLQLSSGNREKPALEHPHPKAFQRALKTMNRINQGKATTVKIPGVGSRLSHIAQPPQARPLDNSVIGYAAFHPRHASA